MKTNSNPHLEEVTFLNEETYSQATAVVAEKEGDYQQQYLTDATFKGMLVLSTFNDHILGKEAPPVVLYSERTGREKILTYREGCQFLSFYCTMNDVNKQLLDYLIHTHKLTVTQDFIPPQNKNQNNKGKSFRNGTLYCTDNTLTKEGVAAIIRDATQGGDFFMIRQEDHQGRDPTKTYFAVDMRHQSRQEQGMAVFKLMMKEHLDAEASFWPLKGSLNKYWVVIDQVIQRDNLLQ